MNERQFRRNYGKNIISSARICSLGVGKSFRIYGLGNVGAKCDVAVETVALASLFLVEVLGFAMPWQRCSS